MPVMCGAVSAVADNGAPVNNVALLDGRTPYSALIAPARFSRPDGLGVIAVKNRRQFRAPSALTRLQTCCVLQILQLHGLAR